MDKREKQKEVFVTLVNKQLEPFNVTYQDFINDADWYSNYTTTLEKQNEFINWGVSLIKESLGLSQKMAEQEMSWFILQWGLKTSQNESNVKINPFSAVRNSAKKINTKI